MELAANIDFGMETSELLKILAPFIIVQYGLVIYCIINIVKNGVNSLNKLLWILICIFAGIFGPILYLTIGKRKDV